MERTVYRSLNPRPLKSGAACQKPNSYIPVRLSTPAIEVMTDFQMVSPVTIGPDESLGQATNAMIARGVRLLFVVNADGVIIGLITARDTTGERPIKLIRDRGGKHSDLRVEDVMTRHENIEALTITDVLNAEVGHILQTLKHIGRQHAIVVEADPNSGAELVRGIFSATNIGRRLGVPIQTFEVARTFAEIEAALTAT
jgi:CBS-domain-containing membrane protein